MGGLYSQLYALIPTRSPSRFTNIENAAAGLFSQPAGKRTAVFRRTVNRLTGLSGVGRGNLALEYGDELLNRTFELGE